jgi:hypothetical protein
VVLPVQNDTSFRQPSVITSGYKRYEEVIFQLENPKRMKDNDIVGKGSSECRLKRCIQKHG